jgi:hypothetical protein
MQSASELSFLFHGDATKPPEQGPEQNQAQAKPVADAVRQALSVARLTRGERVIHIHIFGATGRMGRAIAEATEGRADVRLADGAADVFVDFSAPDALERNLDMARAAGRPILIGTTGLSEAHQALIAAASAEVAVIQAANTSLGSTSSPTSCAKPPSGSARIGTSRSPRCITA